MATNKRKYRRFRNAQAKETMLATERERQQWKNYIRRLYHNCPYRLRFSVPDSNLIFANNTSPLMKL